MCDFIHGLCEKSLRVLHSPKSTFTAWLQLLPDASCSALASCIVAQLAESSVSFVGSQPVLCTGSVLLCICQQVAQSACCLLCVVVPVSRPVDTASGGVQNPISETAGCCSAAQPEVLYCRLF